MNSPGTPANQLPAWLAEEAAVRERQAAGRPDAASRMASMSGLELMQALLAGTLHAPSISRTLDFLLIEVEHGRAVFQGTPGPGHLNPMGRGARRLVRHAA